MAVPNDKKNNHGRPHGRMKKEEGRWWPPTPQGGHGHGQPNWKKEGPCTPKFWWRYVDNDVDTSWYSDTGATDHISGNLKKLIICDVYHGKDKIHMTNGEGMHKY
jgi:hypothetical protein